MWRSLATNPAVNALSDSVERLLRAMEQNARTTEPSTWMLMALGVAVIWALVIRVR